jgi:flagellar hook-basal body complex protein FliE
MAPIDPSFAVKGLDWGIAPVEPAGAPAPAADGQGGGFASALSEQVSALEKTQADATEMSARLATGQASAEDAIMALERARLAMQLASTVRTKSVEAIQDLLHTQV